MPTVKQVMRRWVTPLVRLYLRWAPSVRSKEWFWRRIALPYFAYHRYQSYRFVASTRFGARIAGDTHEAHQQSIYFFGVWEPTLTRWISEKLRPGDTFVDVGAHIGYYTLLAASLVASAGRVVAIEPSPAFFQALRGNLLRNKVQNVRAINVAASDEEGLSTIFRGPDSNLGATTLVAEQGFAAQGQVSTESLRHILHADEMRTTRLIKIDVEGAELAVVKGLLPLLPEARPDLELVVEVHPEHLAQQGKKIDDLLNMMSDVGYRAYALEPDRQMSAYMRPLKMPGEHRPRRVPGPPYSDGFTLGTHVVFSRCDSHQL